MKSLVLLVFIFSANVFQSLRKGKHPLKRTRLIHRMKYGVTVSIPEKRETPFEGALMGLCAAAGLASFNP